MKFEMPESVSLAFAELNREKRKKENIRFWIPITMSFIAIIIAFSSLWLQYKIQPNIQHLKNLKDTVRIVVPYNFPKSESLKQIEIKKK